MYATVAQPPLKRFSLEERDYSLVQTVTAFWRPVDPSDEVRMVELYREGRTTTQLAAQVGVQRTTVSRTAEWAGVQFREVRPIGQQVAEMRRLRDYGETYAAIASGGLLYADDTELNPTALTPAPTETV